MKQTITITRTLLTTIWVYLSEGTQMKEGVNYIRIKSNINP
jgi:hypothetical protein